MMQWLLRLSLLVVLALGEYDGTVTHQEGMTPCRATIAALAGTMEIAPFSLASGKSLPYDAGRYVMCTSHSYTRYFLVNMIGHVPSSPVPIPMQIGFCLPEVCDHEGVIDFVGSETIRSFIPMLFLPQLNMSTVSNITATSPQLDMKYPDIGCTIASIVVGLIVFLVVVSTALVLATMPRVPRVEAASSMPGTPELGASGLARQRSTQSNLGPQGQLLLNVEEGSAPAREITRGTGWQKKLASTTLVKAFSMFGKTGTVPKLVEKLPYRPTDCLNGIRVLSMAWIIMGHTFLMPSGVSGYANQEDIVANPLNKYVAERNIFFQIILGAQSGVDTFFFLAGFLLAHLTLKEIRAGRMKVIPAIILRYIRLTPSLALVMLVFYKIWVFLAEGPFAVRFQDGINSRCDGSWWSELTYTLNFVPFDSNKVCMGWTWYLGDDMIFFIIAIFILPVYHRMRLAGWAIVTLLTGLSFGVTIWLIVRYNLSLYVFDDHYVDYSYYAYSKPYTRIPAYFVGTAAAWLLDEMESRGITRETASKSYAARRLADVTFFVTVLVLIFIVLIPYTDFGDNKNSWSGLVNVLYITFSRPVFAACWAVITLLCYYDYIPRVNGFLAHQAWTPFARLTYGAYLVHPLVIKLSAARSVQFYSFSAMDIIYRFVGNCVLATLGSVGLWILCERPCMTIFSPARKGRAPAAAATPKPDPVVPAAVTLPAAG